MFFPTTFLQYVKDEYEENSSYRKNPATNMYGTPTTSGTGNVGYMRDRGSVLRNETVIPCSEITAVIIRFCGHVFHMIWRPYLNLYADESVRMKPGYLMVVIIYETTTQRCYFPQMVNLVEESVECYLEGQRIERKTDGSETITRIVRMDIEMSVSEVSFRNSDHTRRMIRLTICFSQE